MSLPLSPDRVVQLLPALDPLADTLARRGRLDVADLQVILLGLGLDEDWASQELERWAAILATAQDAERAPLAQRALLLRGVPAEDAARAVARFSQAQPAVAPPLAAPVAPVPARRPWLWAAVALWLIVMSVLGFWLWRQTQAPPQVAVAPPTLLPSATRPATTATLTPQVPLVQPTTRPTDTAIPASPTRPPASPTGAAATNSPTLPAATVTRAATPTPIPPTRTPVPRATLRPSAAACAPPAGPSFIEVWANLGLDERTGCPTAPEKGITTSYQPFEHGFMLWRQDTRQIYAVYDDGLWQVFQDTWQEGQPEYSCPDASTPSRTPPTPRRGLGKAWCTQPGVRDKLGRALQDENGNTRPVQDFQQGTLLSIIERDVPVYALLTPTQRWVGGSRN